MFISQSDFSVAEQDQYLRFKAMQNNFAQAVEMLKQNVNSVSFQLWMKDLEFVDMNGDTLICCANSQTAKKLLQTTYAEIFADAISRHCGNGVRVEIFEQQEKDAYLSKIYAKRLAAEAKKAEKVNPSFNPLYTFDNFVVGNSNNFVYHACKAVAENPGKKFNPLFIYGGVGLGKTHLLHAIANHIAANFPEKKICYNTCENFTNDYIESLRSDNDHATLDFREKYRNVDVLMIDDIQFISNKTSTQEEFFHTFNDLYQLNKQIIISSDRPPKEIATLEERLRSRFASGFIHEIIHPDFETRVAILKKKADLEGYAFDDEVIYYIAEKLDTNIREMEGGLEKVFFLATLVGKSKATMQEALEALKSDENDISRAVTADKIIENVCKYFNLTNSDLVGKKKSKEIVEPRMIAIYLITELCDLPLMSIGQKLGGRDHTTVMHARDKIAKEIQTNQRIKMFVRDIKQLCKV